MGDKESLRVVEEFFDAWNAKDWERWAALHAEDVYHAGPDHAQPLRGREAVMAAHTGLGKVFPDFRYEITRRFAEDSLVCVEWTLVGTHEGPVPAPGGRAAPSGRRISVPGVFVLRVADSVIAEYVGHVDFLGMYVQLGAIPAISADVGRAS